MLKPYLSGRTGCLLLVAGLLFGYQLPMRAQGLQLTESTTALTATPEIPPPGTRVVAAVYPFQMSADQQAPASHPFQTALADQYTSILFRILQSSGWFMPVAPGNIGTLLNGRTTAPAGHTGAQAENGTATVRDRPTILLEAGVFSHDVQNVPNEAGSRYLANSTGGQYRMDRTTVFLRALSAQSGKMLNTVYWTKTLLSQPGVGQTYRYVVLDQLHGNTAGNTLTSPDQFVLIETIKDAVRGLIIEGVRDGLWTSGDLSARQSANVITAYEAEKRSLAEAQQVNRQPRRETSRLNPPVTPSRFNLSLYGGLLRYHGDYADWATNEAYGLSAEVYANPYVGFQLNLASGTLSSQNAFRTKLSSASANLIVNLLPYHRLTPLVYGGVGVVSRSSSTPFSLVGQTYLQYQVGGGLQYSFNNMVGFRVLVDYNLPNTDLLDGKRLGIHNDFYVRSTLGLLLRFGSFPAR